MSSKTTLNIDQQLLREAQQVTGLKEKTAVIHLGLEELVRASARKRLIALGGTMKSASVPKRKRSPHLKTIKK